MESKSRGKAPANINDLRTILMEDIKALRDGQTTPANVNAVCNATGKILSTIKLQMEYAKQTGRMPDIAMLALAAEEPA